MGGGTFSGAWWMQAVVLGGDHCCGKRERWKSPAFQGQSSGAVLQCPKD